MIRINLIPKKVTKKKMGLVQNIAIAGGVYLLVFAVLGYLMVSLNGKISGLRTQLVEAQAEKERLKNVEVEKRKYEENIAKLKSQLDVIAQIKNNRLLPVRILDELTKVHNKDTPVWLTKYRYDGKTVTMAGNSLSNPKLADYVTRLDETPFYRAVDLKFSEKKKQGTENRVLYNFSLTTKPQSEGMVKKQAAE